MSEAPRESRPTFGVARLAEETRQRFVREIVARVPLARLVELHLFAPIRQGGMESGVAVLAALLEGSEEPAAPEPAAAAAAPEGEASADPGTEATPEEASTDAQPIEAARELAAEAEAAERCDPTDAAAGPPPDVDDGSAADEAGVPTDESVAADAGADDVVEARPVVLDAEAMVALVAAPEPDAASAAATAAPPPPEPPRRRHTVFTALYRLVLKGPERGKWDVEMREEADAPLITVEAVVRGVQLRSGDAVESERLDAAAVARLVGQGAPAGGT